MVRFSLLSLFSIVCSLSACSHSKPPAAPTPSGPSASGPAPSCTSDSECAAPACQTATCSAGVCVVGAAQSAATACDDGDPRTLADHCDGLGACSSGKPAVALGRAGLRALYVMPADSDVPVRLTPKLDRFEERWLAVSETHNVGVAFKLDDAEAELIRVPLDGSSADEFIALSVPAATSITQVTLGDDYVFYLRVDRLAGTARVWVASLTGSPDPHPIGAEISSDSPILVTAQNRAVVAHRLQPSGGRVVSISAQDARLTLGPDKAGRIHRLLRTPADQVVYAANTANVDSPSDASARVYRADPAVASSEVMLLTDATWVVQRVEERGRYLLLQGPAVDTPCFVETQVSAGVDACAADNNSSLSNDRYGKLTPANYVLNQVEDVLAVVSGTTSAFRVLYKDNTAATRVLAGLSASGAQTSATVMSSFYDNATYLGSMLNRATVLPTRIMLYEMDQSVHGTTASAALTTHTDPVVWGAFTGSLHGFVTSELGADGAPRPVVHRTQTSGSATDPRSLALSPALSDEVFALLDDGRVLLSSRRDETWQPMLVNADASPGGVGIGPNDWSDTTVLGKTSEGHLLITGVSAGAQVAVAQPVDGTAPISLPLQAADTFGLVGLSPSGSDLLFTRRKAGTNEFELALLSTNGSETSAVATSLTMPWALSRRTTASFSSDGKYALVTLSPRGFDTFEWSIVDRCATANSRIGIISPQTIVAMVDLHGPSRGASQVYPSTSEGCGFFTGEQRALIRTATGLAVVETSTTGAAPVVLPGATSPVGECRQLAPDRSQVYYFGAGLAACAGPDPHVFAYHPTNDAAPRAVSCQMVIGGSRSLQAVAGGVLADPTSSLFTSNRFFFPGDGSQATTAASTASVPSGQTFFGTTPDATTLVSWNRTPSPEFTSFYARPLLTNPSTGVSLLSESGRRILHAFALDKAGVWLSDDPEPGLATRMRRILLDGSVAETVDLPLHGEVSGALTDAASSVAVARTAASQAPRYLLLPGAGGAADYDTSSPVHCARVSLIP